MMRVKELREVGLVVKAPDGYALSKTGRALFNHLEPLGDWAVKWVPTL